MDYLEFYLYFRDAFYMDMVVGPMTTLRSTQMDLMQFEMKTENLWPHGPLWYVADPQDVTTFTSLTGMGISSPSTPWIHIGLEPFDNISARPKPQP